MDRIRTQDLAQFYEQGYFITGVAFAQSTLLDMTNEMDRVYREGVAEAEKSGNAAAVEAAKGRRFYGQFHALSPIAAQFVKSDIYLEACRKLIGPDADLYYNQAAVKAPGKMGKTFARWRLRTSALSQAAQIRGGFAAVSNIHNSLSRNGMVTVGNDTSTSNCVTRITPAWTFGRGSTMPL